MFHHVASKPLREWLEAAAVATGTMGHSRVPSVQAFHLETGTHCQPISVCPSESHRYPPSWLHLDLLVSLPQCAPALALGQGVRADAEVIMVHFKMPILGAAPPGAVTKMLIRGSDCLLVCAVGARSSVHGWRNWLPDVQGL